MGKEKELFGAPVERGIVQEITSEGVRVASSERDGIVTPYLACPFGFSPVVGQVVYFVLFRDGKGELLGDGTAPAGGGSSVADYAHRLVTPRKIALTGEVTGSADFDGSADANINTQVNGVVKSVNGNAPDEAGAVSVYVGVKTVNGQQPGGDGNAVVDVGVKTVNGQRPDGAGNAAVDVGVKTVKGQQPDGAGNAAVDVGVKSVNGVFPDGNGAVVIDTGGGGSGSTATLFTYLLAPSDWTSTASGVTAFRALSGMTANDVIAVTAIETEYTWQDESGEGQTGFAPGAPGVVTLTPSLSPSGIQIDCTVAPAGNVRILGYIVHRDTAITAEGEGGASAFTLLDVYPIGSVYISAGTASPAALFGGDWEKLEGRFLLGTGSAYTLGDLGGEAEHTLTIDEMPSHSHSVKQYIASGGNADGSWAVLDNTNKTWKAMGDSVYSTGGSQPHNNLPPYLAVNMWKRVA